MSKQRESILKSAILQMLNTRPFTKAVPIRTTGIPNGNGGFRKNPNTGVSDILACIKGRFLALEVKTENGKATDNQRNFLREIAEAGGYASIVHSVDEAMEAWNELVSTEKINLKCEVNRG